MENTSLFKRCIAEGIGSALLVLIGAGTATYIGIITAYNNTSTSLADVGVIAFAFAIMGMIYTIGKFSGGHINPAVTIGLASTVHFPWREVPAYLIAQLVGGVVGAFGIMAVSGLDGVVLGNLGATTLGSNTGYIQGIAKSSRTFGPYVVDSIFGGNINWIQFPIYVIGFLIGAIVAAFTYRVIATSKQFSLSNESTHNEVVE